MQLGDALKRFKDFVSGVNISSDASKWSFGEDEYAFYREDLSVLLSGADAQSYVRCLRDLYTAVAPREMFSRSTVDHLANTAFSRIIRESRSLPKGSPEFQTLCQKEVKQLKSALEAEPHTWEVISRACGLDPTGLPITVGKVTFVLATPEVLDNLPEASFTKPATREHFAGSVVARIFVPAGDSDSATANATRILQETLDCINFFAATTGASSQGYIPGERETGSGLTILSGGGRFVHHAFLYGPAQLLPLTRLVGHSGLQRISKLLESDKLTKLQQRILRAFQWAGRAQVDSRREESFLLMAIALESLLLGNQTNENISYKVALRAAHLIGPRDISIRKSLCRDVKDLYNRRSAIVHSGRVEVSDSELALLRHYLRAALFVAINNSPFAEMTAEEEFDAWFEERALEVSL